MAKAMERQSQPNADFLKGLCSRLYENKLLRLVFGDSFHPGGERLTRDLGKKMGLTRDSTVLDVACGVGASAIVLSESFGSRLLGIDISRQNIADATSAAAAGGLSGQVKFVQSDAEELKLQSGQFDAVVCECALSTFPDKEKAVGEMFRVLKDGGRLGVSDMTVEKPIPEYLDKAFYYLACVSGALTRDEYLMLLENSGFTKATWEDERPALEETVDRISRLRPSEVLGASRWGLELMKVLGLTEERIAAFGERARAEIAKGTVGYAVFLATRP